MIDSSQSPVTAKVGAVSPYPTKPFSASMVKTMDLSSYALLKAVIKGLISGTLLFLQLFF